MQPLKFSVVVSIIRALWAIMLLYWLASAFGNKRAKIRQPLGSRVAYIFIFMVSYSVLESHRRALAISLFPVCIATQIAGIVLCAAGLAFAIWARRVLGANWSGFVMIKQDHDLIQSGPYRFVRHPIYTGLILAVAGTMLAVDPTLAGCLLILLWGVAFYIKAQREERMLTQEFGDQYADYKRRVRAALIPNIL